MRAVQAKLSLSKIILKTNLDYGPLTNQLVKAIFLMMKDHVFWTWDDNEHAWQSRKFQDRHFSERKGNGICKSDGGFKRTGNAYLG